MTIHLISKSNNDDTFEEFVVFNLSKTISKNNSLSISGEYNCTVSFTIPNVVPYDILKYRYMALDGVIYRIYNSEMTLEYDELVTVFTTNSVEYEEGAELFDDSGIFIKYNRYIKLKSINDMG